MKTNFEQYVVTELASKAAAKEGPNILLLTCMDYRYAHRITNVMDSMGLRRKYDIFVLAGAAAGANEKPVWRQALIEHIRTARSINHPIDHVIIFEHRDCGAYKAFFGLDWSAVTPPVEEEAHKEQAGELINDLKKEFVRDIPNLTIDAFLLARDEDDALFETHHP